jgi:hypothetical protein
MNSVREMMIGEMILGLVQMKIFCNITGKVLDYRTCKVLFDKDGLPEDVIHESAEIPSEIVETLEGLGYTIKSQKGK